MTQPSAGRSRRWIMIGLAMAVCATALAGAYAWFAGTSLPVSAGPGEAVTIATNTAYAGACPILAAQQNGYFADDGIVATVQAQSSGKAALEAVLQGKADLGTVADIPVMFAAMNNQPVSVIATMFRTDKDHGIVGRRDRGIATVADLKGKRIGVTLNTSGHFALDALLNRQMLSPGDVAVRNYKPEELPAALVQGDVDAVATWEPFLGASLKELGSNGVVAYGQDVYAILYNVAGMRDYVVRHPETMRNVLRAITRGARFCSDEPDAARALVAAATRIDATTLKAWWPSYRFKVALDQGLLLALEDEARWAIKNRLTRQSDVPNFLDYIYLDGMEAVAPSAVTIIH